ncbi:hypothetical protein MLD38_005464 [Melastoma candidum]|uniref:Uncharacterized protein n=1 Tax=Melastoma candidum TaxID=119954 RepID=A0ACB9RNE6_9MYRT|nr:hypothetical protein MLD38_005464 [Melastoma candidum]
MGERKVLNKYYPPDFDSAKLPRVRRPKNQQIKVRMMLPMSIRCPLCGNYIYKGTEFNSRKEDVIGETYLGIQIFRFYFKCTKCSAGVLFLNDNTDYVIESGATGNFEPWREKDEIFAFFSFMEAHKEKRKREQEEMGDAMKSLENRTMDSKWEMDILAALDEMKSMKSRHATVSIDAMPEALQRTYVDKENKLEEEDVALIKSIVFHNSKDFVRRIEDDSDSNSDEVDELCVLSSSVAAESSSEKLNVSNEASTNETIGTTDDGISMWSGVASVEKSGCDSLIPGIEVLILSPVISSRICDGIACSLKDALEGGGGRWYCCPRCPSFVIMCESLFILSSVGRFPWSPRPDGWFSLSQCDM